MRVDEAAAAAAGPSGRRWKKRFTGSVSSFHPAEQLSRDSAVSPCYKYRHRRPARENAGAGRNENNAAKERKKKGRKERERKGGKDTRGRSSWTCKGGDEEEGCWKAVEEKSEVERAILSPSKCFLFEKWSLMAWESRPL